MITLRKLTPEEWAAIPQSSEAKREAKRRWAKANPDKAVATRRRWEAENPDAARAVWRAHKRVHNALLTGHLTRPSLCEDCGQPGRRIEAGHIDYSQPLNVRWLCPPCHRLFDRRNPKTKALA